MVDLRTTTDTFAAVIVGAVTGALGGTLLGAVVGVGVGLFTAIAEGRWYPYHMAMGALILGTFGNVFGQVVGAILWFYFWKRRGYLFSASSSIEVIH